ncbi:MAG: superoxide dismutase [Bacteroidetes bacterium HGW-Bacteroidetes-1]|jgi:Fe-Mn family superoxide dismutase|nr:MAG: superoxide dismutase [Bacteroidetes bacterium HGW-Bacteroidetes-1]
MKNVLTLLLISFITLSVSGQKTEALKKLKVEYAFAPLPYAYDALQKSIDKETMEIHYDRHHRAYFNNFVKSISGTEMEYITMEKLFAEMSKYPAAVRNNGGGYFNHTMFWNMMSPDGGGIPEGELAAAITRSFGSFDEFKKEFEKAGATRFGSGWVWLSLNDQGKLFISSTPNQDNPLMDVAEQRGKPILAVDVWEHAYYLRYQNKRASYLSAFWEVANWKEIARRYNEALN